MVICCYFEEQSLPEFYGRLKASLEGLGRSYEIVLVNDGSTDGTFQRMRGYFETDTSVRAAIDFFRNSGHAAAITAGLCECSGKNLVLIDSDLQLDPEDLTHLVSTFDQGFDVVSGKRLQRNDALWRRWGSVVHNMLVRHKTGLPFTDFGCTFKIINADLVRAFGYGPFNPVRQVATLCQASRVCEVPVAHHPRKYGRSGWTLIKFAGYININLLPDLAKPLRWGGTCALAFAVLFTAHAVAQWQIPFGDTASIPMHTILGMLTTELLATLGSLFILASMMLSRTSRPRDTPAYIIREALRRDNSDKPEETLQ